MKSPLSLRKRNKAGEGRALLLKKIRTFGTEKERLQFPTRQSKGILGKSK